MTQKEKLIELLSEHHSGSYDEAQKIADYLLDNGVVVLPCKVGDTVYTPIHTEICNNPNCYSCDSPMDVCEANCGSKIVEDKIIEEKFQLWMLHLVGKEIFITREEAEAALREEKRP